MSRNRSPRRGRAASRDLPRPVLWTIGIGGILAVVVMFLVGYNAPNSIPGKKYFTVKAAFDHANNLTGHYQVRIGGRNVGQVLRPKVVDGKAVVELQMNPDVEPLRSDSTVRVRPRSPIGVRFVELTPGTKGEPLKDGDLIPATQTSAATELDTTLNTLDAERRERVQDLLAGFGGGVAGRGESIGDLLEKGAPGLNAMARLAKPINDRPNAARGFISGSEGAAAAADPVRETIRRGFGQGSAALDAFADNGEALKETLREAPAALASLQTGMRQADPLLREVRALSRTSLAALRPAPAGLRELNRLQDEATPGLKAARSTLTKVDEATDPTIDLLQTIDPILPAASEALATSLPIMDRLSEHECDIAYFAETWGSMLGFGIPGGEKKIGSINSLRLNLIPSEESVAGSTGKSGSVASNPYPAPCTVKDDAKGRR